MNRQTIEQAADNYAAKATPSYTNGDFDRNAIAEAFECGANWRINSVWHDASEIPKANKRTLVCFENVIGEYVYYRIRAFKPNVLKNLNMGNFSLDKVLYWCNLDDLLPEIKEETE